jgi:ketosteroid isomerase-like protein
MQRQVAVVLVLMALAPAAHGQVEAGKEGPLHTELNAVFAEITAAYKAGDLDKLTSYLDDNCVVTWPDATVNKSATEVKNYLKAKTQGPHRVVDTTNIELASSGMAVATTTAVVYGRSLDHIHLTEGADYDQWTTWTATLVKKEGRWRITSLHLSTNMFDNPVLALVFKRTAWWVGSIVGVVAFVLGCAGGWAVGQWRSGKNPTTSAKVG